VQGAITSISAPIVELNTQHPNVPSNQSQPIFHTADKLLLQRIPSSPPITPVRVERLKVLLQSYTTQFRDFLVNVFTCGFRVSFVGERRAFESPNLLSARKQPLITTDKLNKEITSGRIVGPFVKPPLPDFIVSPLGIVPKKAPNEYRLIHHLSYPDGSSVNDSIPHECSTVRYASILDAIAVIKQTGAGCFMAKTDIKSAFQIIPIHPNDYPLLGMKWYNLYYFDRCLPMGCSSSCAIFEKFSTALEWLAKTRIGASGVLHILDDVLFITKDESKCRSDLTQFLALCDYLGVLIAQEKTVGSETVLQFAGITLDSINMEARLPEDKLQKCRTLLTTFSRRRKATLRELQSLLGFLNFTCS